MKPQLASLLLTALAALTPLDAADPSPCAPALPAYRHPGGGQIFYFVLTDRFANGNPANDRGGLTGDRNVTGFDPTDRGWYQGGDFTGLVQKLDYLQGLGITAIWVTPPFRNQPVQENIGAYHGYWILDFLAIDPHLGSDREFRDFVAAAHARGIKVFLDIICNHTADVIKYPVTDYSYRTKAESPLRDANGTAIDEAPIAWNGIDPNPRFPALTADASFALKPIVPPGLEHAKNPAWLNDVTLYHNRGNTTFKGENSLYGDFVGLDDLMTENPRVVRGFIDVYTYWMREYKIDGFRIDTVKHVNPEFWQAFSPALRAEARALGRPDFFHFGEVAGASSRFLGDYASETNMDGTLDFAFYGAAKDYIAKGLPAAVVRKLFDDDDLQIRPLGSAHLQTTFLGNHDDGRFLYFVRAARPEAAQTELLGRSALAHALLFASRGQPVIYYGDEQGMNVIGNDVMARETLFASQAPGYREATLIGSNRRGSDDKYDTTHPLYRLIGGLAALRKAHPTLLRGATVPHDCGDEAVLAFSRIERGEKREYLAVFNNDANAGRDVAVTTLSPTASRFSSLTTGANWALNASAVPTSLESDPQGRVRISLPPLGWCILRSDTPVPEGARAPRLAIHAGDGQALSFDVRETDFHRFSDRQPIEAAIEGGDGLGEVTFTARRASRPGQTELLGVDDTPPYRVFWRPPSDWVEGDRVTFHASFNDLRGHMATALSAPISVAQGSFISGVRGARTPHIISAAAGPDAPGVGIRTLTVLAEGSGPLEYQWYRADEVVAGANQPILKLGSAERGRFRVLVSGPGGAVLSDEMVVE
ncbi:alpha-amylase family glycosyl hydrolase [Nibricoccus sp. IMCC34717]|uniref:alpha-amylase family glycosyl hydrolase n=1 Tax=Nibricoccus sp. IMCC34717 TaxID=3034021 RepID=UPI00384F21A5